MTPGFVVGTGDLSELALGWCTYNADHMSMYNPNCSIPKTLVRFLVRYVGGERVPDGPGAGDAAVDRGDDDLARAAAGSRRTGADQSTEATLGPYELHDFFLYHFLRYGIRRRRSSSSAGTPRSRYHIRRTRCGRLWRPFTGGSSPAVQAVVRAGRPEGRHGQPLAARRLADAERRGPVLWLDEI